MTSLSTLRADASRQWQRGRWFAPAAAVVILLRWRYLFTPITADEGGYLAEARAWGRGAVLYRDVWVDRPQGLVLLFRIWNDIGLGSPVGVRIMALVATLIGAAAAGCIAKRLAGAHAGWIAALAVGVIGSIPQQESFIANSELLSSALGILALAVLLLGFWDRDRPWYRILALGGILGGCALSMKQSGFDAFFAGLIMLLVVSLGRRWSTRDRLLAIPAALGGLMLPILAMMIHGAVTGWHRWWYAFAGYRLDQRSALQNAEWGRLRQTGGAIGPLLLPTVILGLALVVWLVRRTELRAAALLAVWSVLALIAFLLGGQFFRHYWVIFAFPLGTGAGVLAGYVRQRGIRLALVVWMLVVPVVATLVTLGIPRDDVGQRLSDDGRLIASERIADWFDEQREPGDNIYAMCASAALYGNADTDPPYPYLWFALIPQVPGAQQMLIDMMEGPDAPTFVAVFQPARTCDPSGAVESALSTRYELATTIEEIDVYRLSQAT